MTSLATPHVTGNNPQPGTNLPEPGPQKRDADKLDKLLDTALEDSMAASDPPQMTQPDVKRPSLIAQRASALKSTAYNAVALRPLQALATAVGVGLVIGLLVRRS